MLDVRFSPLREEVIELPGGVTLINDCYNANPASMRAALEHLAELAGGRRKLAVLGEMAELGERSACATTARSARRRCGPASTGIVAVGPLAAEYLVPAVGIEVTMAETAEEAVPALRALIRPGDVVLVKGSRAVGLEAVAAKLRT